MKKLLFLLLIPFVACVSKKNDIVHADIVPVSSSASTDFSVSSYESLDNSSSGSKFSNDYSNASDHKYNSRIGYSGGYEYNYDVSGSDDDGNYVDGNIDIQGKYGSGYIRDDFGNDKYVDVEWTGKGTLEGTDEDGTTYDLEVDN